MPVADSALPDSSSPSNSFSIFMNWNMQKELEQCATEVQEAYDDCPVMRINLQLNACRKILDAQMEIVENAR